MKSHLLKYFFGFVILCLFSPYSFCQGQVSGDSYPSDRELKILEMPLPVIPEEVRNMHIQGTIVLRVTFLSTSDIGNVTTVAEVPYLSKVAIDAAKKIKFEPKIKNGISTSLTKTIRYTFDFENGWQNQLNKRVRILKKPDVEPSLSASIHRAKTCLVFLNVEFLDSKEIGNVTMNENTCKDILIEKLAIELAKKIEFEPAIRENFPITDTKLISFEFEKVLDEKDYDNQ